MLLDLSLYHLNYGREIKRFTSLAGEKGEEGRGPCPERGRRTGRCRCLLGEAQILEHHRSRESGLVIPI